MPRGFGKTNVISYATIAARNSADPTPVSGAMCYCVDTDSIYIGAGVGWKGLPKGRLGITNFGQVNVSGNGTNFAAIAFTLVETRIIVTEYLMSAIQQTSNGAVNIGITMTGQTTKRAYNATVTTGNSLTNNGTPISGRNHWSLAAGSYTAAITVVTISAGAIRSDVNWDNFIAVYDYGT